MRARSLQVHPFPGLIRVEAGHLACQGASVGPEILSLYEALVIDDEGLNPGYAILRRPRYQCEPTDHFAFHGVVQCAAGGIRPLRFQNAEVITVIRLGLGGPGRRGEGLPDQVLRSIIRIQPVLLARSADDPLCVFEDAIPVAIF